MFEYDPCFMGMERLHGPHMTFEVPYACQCHGVSICLPAKFVLLGYAACKQQPARCFTCISRQLCMCSAGVPSGSVHSLQHVTRHTPCAITGYGTEAISYVAGLLQHGLVAPEDLWITQVGLPWDVVCITKQQRMQGCLSSPTSPDTPC